LLLREGGMGFIKNHFYQRFPDFDKIRSMFLQTFITDVSGTRRSDGTLR
jgi:hypothetical protein